MLNLSTFQWDSLNCTCKSGNVGQACKICAHPLLSLFSFVGGGGGGGGECFRRGKWDNTAYTV